MKEKRKKNAKRIRKQQELEDDILQQQSLQTNELMRPFVTCAYAQTLDGMIAAKGCHEGEASTATSNLLLSSPESMMLTHHLRGMHDAILVGGSTFLLDQPRLNVRLPATAAAEPNACGGGMTEHPMPIVLDTHLNCLQRLLFDKIITASSAADESSSTAADKDAALPEISLQRIRAHNPIICCSTHAAQSFLDILQDFQLQQEMMKKRKRTKSYNIVVYKTIDDEMDSERDIYLPIKITIFITHHDALKKEEVGDTVASVVPSTHQEVTLTLLPCPLMQDGNEAAQTKFSNLGNACKQ